MSSEAVSKMLRGLSVFLFSLLMANACSQTSSGTDAAVDARDGQGAVDGDSESRDEADVDRPQVVDTGEIFIDDCKQFASACDNSTSENCGKCQYRIFYRADVCTKDSPCENAFAYWPAMASESDNLVKVMNDILESHPNFVIFTLQPNYPGEVLPISLGAPEREVMLLKEVFEKLKSKDELGIWTGERLLMGGCSQGATVYPVVAARYPQDSDWTGTKTTAVCMSDGVVDMRFQENFIGKSTGQSCVSRHMRVAAAYTVENPVQGHSCSDSPMSQCACDPGHSFIAYPGDCNDGDCVEFDSIVGQFGRVWEFSKGLSADSFAVQHWKLITEGGSWNTTNDACLKDVVAAEPYRGLCSLLDADEKHSCTYESFPESPHCGYYNSHLNELCLEWFLSLEK